MDNPPPFIPGLELSRVFYVEAVRPILDRRFPGLVHGAALLHTGSDVLGFDSPRSMDHHWGPKTDLFLAEADYTPSLVEEIRRVLGAELPFEIRGYPTHFASPDVDGGRLQRTSQRPITHAVRVRTARRFFVWYLGLDPLVEAGLTLAQWLAIPEQHLRTVTCGWVFHDGTGELTRARDILRWYPHDLWLYLLAAQWRRIEQEEPFVGRCGEAGDDLGSRLVAARLVRELIRLCFLIERQYAPYTKWLGTAFSRLACAPRLTPRFDAALRADTWQERERQLSAAYETAAELHNGLSITAPLPTRVSPFHGRPYQVIHGDRFWTAIQVAIADEAVHQLPPHLGSITQWIDSTDVLSYPKWFGPLRTLYAGDPPPPA